MDKKLFVHILKILLEYLPTTNLRLKAVKKAIELLKPFGILLIVTPDSSHQGKNQNQMKSWRLAMAQLGMIRIYIDKLQHVHCLGFVKIQPTSDFDKVFESEIQQTQSKFSCADFNLQSAFYTSPKLEREDKTDKNHCSFYPIIFPFSTDIYCSGWMISMNSPRNIYQHRI